MQSLRAAVVSFVSLLGLIGPLANAQQSTTVFPGTTNVGQQSTPVTVTVTMKTNGTAGTPQALTQGVPAMDFSLGSGGTCAAGTNYSAGQQCTVSVVFSPKYPGVRSGVVVVPGQGGGALGTAFLAGTGKGGLGVLNPGQIVTVAGSGNWIYKADGVAATSAEIFLPMGVVEDTAGNMFISDTNNNRVRRVDAQSGIISTVAGNGTPGYSGDGGAATQAMISGPAGIALDGAGDVYFADSGNHVVRRVDAFTGVITTVAGTPTVQGYGGDGAAATAAKLSLPEGVAFGIDGKLFIADTGNNVVRVVDPSTGTIRTVAGTGVAGYNGDGRAATSATLNEPWSVTPLLDGTSFLIADMNNNRVRIVDGSGSIATFAGNGTQGFSGDGGPAAAAALNAPAAVVQVPSGNLFIADSGNNRIRRINISNREMSTVAGTDSEQFAGDGGPASTASMYGPYALFFDQTGNLLISDLFHNRIRRINGTYLKIDFDTMRVGKVSPSKDEGFENYGNDNLTIAAPTLTNAALGPDTTCTTGSVLVSTQRCLYGVEFAPQQVGDLITGQVLANSDAANTPATFDLDGKVLSVEPTSVSLTSSENPSLIGDNVIFTATVASNDTGRTGTVTFLDGTATLCDQVTINGNGVATCAISTLALGQHSITANYSGDNNNAAAVSPTLIQIVQQATTLVLSAAPNPATVTQTVTLTLQASAATGTPTGTIKFFDGTTQIGTGTLNGAGVATMTTSSLTPGAHSLTAQYSGDTNDAAGTSNTVSEEIDRAATVTTLSTSAATVPVGTTVIFTATVATTNGPAPTGSVTFMDGTTTLGTGTVNSSGVATFTTSALAPGAHSIVASYSGDTNDAESTSAALTETVQQIPTTTTLTSDLNPANAGATIHFTAKVAMATGSTADGPIDGTVTFTDGATVLGTANVDPATGTAVLPVSGLAVGAHAIVASYAGNTNYAASTSPALSEQVQSTGTTTVLSSGASNSLAGKPVALTATVTSSTGGIPGGLVTFKDGNTVIGTGTLNAQGVATLTTSTLSVGSHNLVAVYGGDNNYSTSTSAPLVQVIALATTGLTLAGPTGAVDGGTLVTITAALTSNGVAPTGTITLKDGNTVIGTKNVTDVGTFTFTTSTLSIGTHTLTAVYSGDANSSPATSNSITVIVQQASSATSLTSSLNPAVVGQTVTFTATVTSNSPNPTGTISFMDGTTALGSSAIGANGVATFTTSSLAFGQHTISAVYSGDTNHGESTSPPLTENIVQAAQAAITSSLNPSVSGNNVVFTAKIIGVGNLVPTGQVTFTDSTTTLGTATLDATGTATYQTSTLSVGSHTIGVSYAGDKNYSNASASLIQTVGNADTTIALTASANPAVYGAPVDLVATIKSNGGVPTGTVTFTDGGVTIGTAVLDASGVATLTTSTLAPGAHSIVANYPGDGKASPSSSTPLALVVKQVTSVAVLSSANPAQTLDPITFTATVTNPGASQPTGTVTFTDGTTNLGTVNVDATGHATITVPSLAAGNHPIQASYTGDDKDFPSQSQVLTQGVQLRPTTTALSSTSSDPNNPMRVTLIAIVHWNGTATPPTGKVTFKTGSTTIGSAPIDATGVATLTITLASQKETIVATYEGDANYASSDSLATDITGEQATQFTMTLDPPNATVQSKDRTTGTLTLSSIKGFTDKMQFGCLGLPYAATCTFTVSDKLSPDGTLPADGTLQVQVTVDTGNPLGSGANTSSNAAFHSHTFLAILPGGLLAALALLRRKRRMVPALLLALFGLALSLGVTGCSGLQTNGTPAGTYTFKVTAAGAGTGITQSVNMTLTVK